MNGDSRTEQLAALSRIIGTHFEDAALLRGVALPDWESLFQYLTEAASSVACRGIWHYSARGRYLAENGRRQIYMTQEKSHEQHSTVHQVSRIETLAELLRDRVGALLFTNALREDMKTAFDTVKNWLEILQNFYFVFLLTRGTAPWCTARTRYSSSRRSCMRPNPLRRSSR